jgi:hypothetical protein
MFRPNRSVNRASLRKRPRKGRHLTRQQWDDLRDKVVHLDIEAILRWATQTDRLPVTISRDERLRATAEQIEVCPAVVMDPSQLGTCSGEWRQDHVKTDPRIGVKAPDDEDHLINLCGSHDERGSRAGHQWNTAHREDERAYLRWRAGLRGSDARDDE